ncbi:MAG TPA: hypothetical protein VK612_11865 [Pyrinomonadaceae bacterium]|nr:hypothetical protein [Pyrinomonadaceae bacterium]
MKKQIYTGLAALFIMVGFTAFAVAGSSFDLGHTLFESVKDNPITRLFSSPVKTEAAMPNVLDSITQNKHVISGGTRADSVREVSEYILWRVILGFPEGLKADAEKARAEGKPESLFTNYFTRQVKLSPENADIQTKRRRVCRRG